MKPFYKSRQLWVYFITFIGALLNELGITNLPLNQDANWIAIVLSAIGIILRLITKEPIDFTIKRSE